MGMDNMFCFQCEQTAFSKACVKSGVCGKKPDTANLQDRLVGALITLARSDARPDAIADTLIDGLFTTITNVNFDNAPIEKRVENALQLAGAKPFDMRKIWNADEDTRSLKSLILFGLKGMAAYAHHARVLGFRDAEIDAFFKSALASLAEEKTADELLGGVMKVGEMNLRCMELLDRANTQSYGDPVATETTSNIEAGPFIIVSGHDLKDLHELLVQTQHTGVNVYTHGEMLPCHAYPELKKFKNLKGNFGTAWQHQQNEFDGVPAPILFTTNCIMPVKKSYADRVFTCGVVGYPETVHIGETRDFSPVIKKAMELGGYKAPRRMTGINGGCKLSVGYGRKTAVALVDKVLQSIAEKRLRRIFLVGGCDGAKVGRNYFTEFVKMLPHDTVVLTLACGKYRFNDIDLGFAGPIPRLMDMGQCNDAYSAIAFAAELSKRTGLGLNELPLSLVLSWYEQKAVCVLLTLLYLGIKNIRLGPTLPAFAAPKILEILSEKFGIKPITTPENDIRDLLGDYQASISRQHQKV